MRRHLLRASWNPMPRSGFDRKRWLLRLSKWKRLGWCNSHARLSYTHKTHPDSQFGGSIPRQTTGILLGLCLSTMLHACLGPAIADFHHRNCQQHIGWRRPERRRDHSQSGHRPQAFRPTPTAPGCTTSKTANRHLHGDNLAKRISKRGGYQFVNVNDPRAPWKGRREEDARPETVFAVVAAEDSARNSETRVTGA